MNRKGDIWKRNSRWIKKNYKNFETSGKLSTGWSKKNYKNFKVILLRY